MASQPALYIPHGGGPCFFMEWTLGPRDTWVRMGDWLRDLGATLPSRPAAIVLVSAHWETDIIGITGGERPPLIYDYYGFPEHTYTLEYPAPGAPALAAEVAALLVEAGIAAQVEPERGFDHGMFIPLKLMFPAADIPVLQVSLHTSLDPQRHLAIGRALAALRARNVLIVGSGMSYHNLQAMMSGSPASAATDEFDTWLVASCGAAGEARADALARWQAAPGARAAHPREEHLVPLMVAAGAAHEVAGECVFSDRVMGGIVSAIRFG